MRHRQAPPCRLPVLMSGQDEASMATRTSRQLSAAVPPSDQHSGAERNEESSIDL